MAPDFEAVIADTKRYADVVRSQLPVDKVYLYGSYAKRTADTLSDVDVAVFLRHYGGKERIEVGIHLLRIARDFDIYIEPLAFETSDLYANNPFVDEILRSGLEL